MDQSGAFFFSFNFQIFGRAVYLQILSRTKHETKMKQFAFPQVMQKRSLAAVVNISFDARPGFVSMLPDRSIISVVRVFFNRVLKETTLILLNFT